MKYETKGGTITAELLETEKLCANLEEKHGIVAKGGKVRPTVGYMRELAHSLGCKTTEAWQIWVATFSRIEAIRKRHEQSAELAFWYKIDPWQLDDERRLALLANLPRVKAQDTLHRGDFDPTDYGFAYHVTLLATGDEKRAVRARGDAMERLIDQRTRR